MLEILTVMDQKNGQQSSKCSYNFAKVEFCQCSVASSMGRKYTKGAMTYPNNHNIIVGGYGSGQMRDGNQFYNIILTNKKSPNELTFQPFEGSEANLTTFHNGSTLGAENVHCCLINRTTSKHKSKKNYLLLYEEDGSNVYDMDTDEWLSNKRDITVAELLWTDEDRYLLINDEIVIISAENELYILFIGNDHIMQPLVLYKYKLKTKSLDYEDHGMVCTQFKQEKISDEIELGNTMVELEIILFGGFNNVCFGKSLLKINIKLTYNDDYSNISNSTSVSDNRKDDMEKSLEIKETLLQYNNIKCINFDKNLSVLDGVFDRFGYQCIFNSKNEGVIIVIGGRHNIDHYLHGSEIRSRKSGKKGSRMLHLFNAVTNEMYFYDNVC